MSAYRIDEIQPNPFRHIDRYPIRRDKVEALKESLRTTGFWGNVVARVQGGKPQIAYGHHRLVALREEYGQGRKVDLIVRDLDDEAMLKIMARENMEEWGTSAAVEHETVRAVVEAYAGGLIELPRPSASIPAAQIRSAPSFVMGKGSQPADCPYTAREIAEFLGWLEPSGQPQDKVKHALAALQFVEEGILAESDFDGLTTMQAQAVVEQARRAKADREAAARVQRQEAERAEREAKQAEQRRKAAERERDDTGMREAVEAKQAAEQRQRQAQRREEQERTEGRKQASTVGRHVSKSIRSGKTGYKQAGQVAQEVREKRQGPPPHIDDFALRLAVKLNRILDPEQDERVRELDALIRFRSDMSARALRELVAELDGIANRAHEYRDQLMDAGRSTPTTTVQQPTQRRALPSSDRRG